MDNDIKNAFASLRDLLWETREFIFIADVEFPKSNKVCFVLIIVVYFVYAI